MCAAPRRTPARPHPTRPAWRAGYLAKHYGWKWGLMAPGAFGFAAGLVLLLALKDKPEDAGGTH